MEDIWIFKLYTHTEVIWSDVIHGGFSDHRKQTKNSSFFWTIKYLFWVLSGSFRYILPKQHYQDIQTEFWKWNRRGNTQRAILQTKPHHTENHLYSCVSSHRQHGASGSWEGLVTELSWIPYAHHRHLSTTSSRTTNHDCVSVGKLC